MPPVVYTVIPNGRYSPRAVRLQVFQATKLTTVRHHTGRNLRLYRQMVSMFRGQVQLHIRALRNGPIVAANHAAICLIAQLRARAALSAPQDCTQSTADHCKGDSHNRHIIGHDRPSTDCFDTASVVQVTGV